MAAEEAKQPQWDGMLEMTKAAQERGTDPLMWAVRISSSIRDAGVSMPSVEVAELLINHICWSNNIPIAWKFLEKALALRVLPLCLFLHFFHKCYTKSKEIPSGVEIVFELLTRYAFSLLSLVNGPNYQKVMASIGDVLQFNRVYGIQSSEAGVLIVEFIFSIIWELVDASLDDGLLELTPEKNSRWPIRSQEIDIDYLDSFDSFDSFDSDAK